MWSSFKLFRATICRKIKLYKWHQNLVLGVKYIILINWWVTFEVFRQIQCGADKIWRTCVQNYQKVKLVFYKVK